MRQSATDYPHPTTAAVSAAMRGNRKTDSGPETRVRRALHSRGFRYRKNFPIDADGLVVRPDIVFRRARLAVFIDGCFWHSCPFTGTHRGPMSITGSQS